MYEVRPILPARAYPSASFTCLAPLAADPRTSSSQKVQIYPEIPDQIMLYSLRLSINVVIQVMTLIMLEAGLFSLISTSNTGVMSRKSKTKIKILGLLYYVTKYQSRSMQNVIAINSSGGYTGFIHWMVFSMEQYYESDNVYISVIKPMFFLKFLFTVSFTIWPATKSCLIVKPWPCFIGLCS